MYSKKYIGRSMSIALAALGLVGCSTAPRSESPVSVVPASMVRIGTVDDRFQSYNVEMVEVIGGNLWKPYGKQADTAPAARSAAGQSDANPVGMDPSIYQKRSPIDLSNPQLRKLAAALGPAYVRVSGTWANTVYFQDSDAPPRTTPPKGFGGVLTRKEWKGVVEFSKAVDAKIVTSFATSPGPRDANGVWNPAQARQLIAYTKSLGGNIAATEFMNEPTYAAMGGAPKGYDAAAYGRDIAVFRPFLKQASPNTIFLGPGSVGEGGSLPMSLGGAQMLKSEDLLAASGPVFDVFSYHFYGAASQRCASMGQSSQTTAEAALSEDWLSRANTVDTFYSGLRDKFEPGKALWITEMADAACGGNPWASTFLDTFRYAVQHGRLARRGVQVIVRSTLASSDYGLLDENTLTPRPDYWTALVWRKLMGQTVLKPDLPRAANIYAYAHCLQGHPGGVTLLVVNADRQRAYDVTLPVDAERYSLTAEQLQSVTIQLNGNTLQLTSNDDLPQPTGVPTRAGRVSFAPVSITFLAIPNAKNRSCQ